jgi:extradiol dioxygenase family protein
MKQISELQNFANISPIRENNRTKIYPAETINRSENLKNKSHANRPFHLSICADNLQSTRYFYTQILGIEERRASKTSAHFDFYGCQITFHEVPGYNAANLQREVDAEDVPVPHFGAAITLDEFTKIQQRLVDNGIEFFSKPRVRFIDKNHEQHVMFIIDPSGHGIEIKSFTKAIDGTWA